MTAVDIRQYDDQGRSHQHDFHQVVLPVAGEMELETPSGLCRVARDQGVLIAAGERHDFRCSGQHRFVVVGLDTRLDGRLFSLPRRRPLLCLAPPVRRHIDLIGRLGNSTSLPPAFCQLWTALLLELLGDDGTGQGAGGGRLVAAMRFIRGNAVRPLSVEEIAEAVNLTASGLAALFRRRGLESPARLVAAARMEYAARELASTNRRVADIALDCGLSEHSALTRAFTHAFGESPAAYRRRFRQCPS